MFSSAVQLALDGVSRDRYTKQKGNPLKLALLLSFLILCSLDTSAAENPSTRISTVANNGMPRDIVSPPNRWNFGPGALWTHKGWQYAAYWDDARQVSVARRQLPDGDWSVVSLPGYQRTETGDRGKGGKVSRGFGDGHEKVSMGISPDGVIHLSFDHHLSTLRYRRTKEPVANDPDAHEWSADLFTPVQNHLGGEKITSVTYPWFTSDGTHFTLYLRLNGGSGKADSNFFTYENGRWTITDEASSKLIDRNWSGGDGTVNAYPHQMAIRNGRRYLTWSWRDTPNPRTSHDLCFAYSDDHGKTWKNNAGEVVGELGKTFISADTPGIVAVPVSTGTRYTNGGSMTVDDEGGVHVLMRGEDGSPLLMQRDPKTTEWTRRTISANGNLVAGRDGDLYLVSPSGLKRAPGGDFDKIDTIVSDQNGHFKDCRMGMDRTRPAQDGWVSVIGQTGKTVTVIDYRIRD